MTEPRFEDFDSLYAHAFQLYEDGRYAEALEVATREGTYFPQRSNFLRYFRASMATRLNNADLALKLLGEMLADGYWLSERTWDEEDFNTIRDLPEFARLRETSKKHLKAAQAEAKPELLTILPAGYTDADMLPLLIGLHGNFSSVRWHKDHWRAASNSGWLVGLPQSSQVFGLDSEGAVSYVWDDYLKTRREILEHYTALSRAYTVDQERVVLGGFSRGAEIAIQLAVTGETSVRGFIAVCPGGPYTTETELWEPIIAEGKGRDLRGYVILGRQDQFAPGTEKLVELLHGVGIACELEAHPGMGHDYPADFNERLNEILAFVLNK
jgi:predicted esterase